MVQRASGCGIRAQDGPEGCSGARQAATTESPTPALRRRNLATAHTGKAPALLAEAQLSDDRTVAVNIVLIQVCQHSPSLPNKLEQPPTRMVVVRIVTQVALNLIDALGKQRNLDLCGAAIGVMRAVRFNDGGFGGSCQHSVRSMRIVCPRLVSVVYPCEGSTRRIALARRTVRHAALPVAMTW